MMRTTLTIDDDIAAVLERLRRTSDDASLKGLINEALRRGLREMTASPREQPTFRTRSVDLGRPRIGSVDDIGEALAVGEGDRFR